LVPIRQSSRRERQRITLSITAEELADELGITVEQLIVLETWADESARQDAGRAWDEALGRILRAREDAIKDAARVEQEQRERPADALRQWGGRSETAT